jgi:Domain of unknown function (DUF4384)
MQARVRMTLRVIVAAMLVIAGRGALPAQDETRDIKPDPFIQARPVQSGQASAAARPAYKAVGPAVNVPASSPQLRQIGLTIWRLRPSRSTDKGARIIVQEAATEVQWTPERISTATLLKVGEHLRFSFESAQKGYLYVIDRERYADKTLGDPTLIFPTTRLRNGDNSVTPGRLIEIPDQSDRPNYFTLQRTRENQVGEELVLLVTPEPLEGITPGANPVVLPKDKVAAWEKQWGRPAQQLELVGGVGRPWTKAEQQAGGDQARLLTQQDPSPQTVFRVAAGPEVPVLFQVNLKYLSEKSGQGK